MAEPTPLPLDKLYHRCDPMQFGFETTADILEKMEVVGQRRAVEALEFGIGIDRQGYNLFAMGPSGVGKHTVVLDYLHRAALQRETPSDWIYVHNFDEEDKPIAIRVPTGRACDLQAAVEELIECLKTALPAAFEGEDFRTRLRALRDRHKEQTDRAFKEFELRAAAHDVKLLRTKEGPRLAPMADGQLLDPEEFRALPEQEQDDFDARREALLEELRYVLDKMNDWERQHRDRVDELRRETAERAVEPFIGKIRGDFGDITAVARFLEAMRDDIIEHAERFLDEEKEDEREVVRKARRGESDPLAHYGVNVLVDHRETEGAPVVYEDDPTLENLLGKVEYVSRYGANITNFSLIRPGSLHRANGGYLVVDARKLLMERQAWEQLKRALYAHQIEIQGGEFRSPSGSNVTLRPEPLPLDVKIVLMGERGLFYEMNDRDPDMHELFKVAADFEVSMDRTEENVRDYTEFIAALVEREELRPFHRTAVARVVEESSRDIGSAEKLSTHMRTISDLLREADYWAGHEDARVVSAKHIDRALESEEFRNGRLRDLHQERILRGTVQIDTDGTRIGQINGLSVIHFGHATFGRPTRISASARVGRGEFIDIEREVELGGPIHSKGVLIIGGYLGARYALDYPLSLSASLVFEQSYAGVDGDSASAAELIALLSAIGQVPIRQSLAITGAIDQAGNVQAIGGVNEKIEGFFDICKGRGLDGTQGVVIPASNVRNLMLRKDVVKAVEEEQFCVWAVETVDEAVELLTGMKPGVRNAKGKFPAKSVNGKVDARLQEFAAKWKAFEG